MIPGEIMERERVDRDQLQAAQERLEQVPEFAWLLHPAKPKDFYNVSEVAKRLGISRHIITDWCGDGTLPGAMHYTRVGWRIPRSGLILYLSCQVPNNG